MDFETRFNELVSKPKDEELIQELTLLQEESIQENDADIYLKTSHLLFDTYVNLGDFDQAISLFLSILKENRFESYKTIVEIIDKLVQLLLKTEDFIQLDAILSMRERYLTGNPSQQLMQKFYRAVCQEGLKAYHEAIKTLESITDNISNNNLVSKYLKLALLYLRVKQPLQAKEAFERAKIYDKLMKNEMFQLVASDIAFSDKQYEEALKYFQAFFIKTKVKIRYLDRYLYINIELNKLGEAWRFYKEYLPKIMKSASKNYRLQFYQAGLALANKVNDIDEAAVLTERIRSLQSVNEEVIDSFDGIKVLLSFSSSKIRFKSVREIILETYRVLASLSDFNRLLYLFPTLDGLTLYTYKKGLLMEKVLGHQDYLGTILESVINEDLSFHLFVKDDILKERDYLTKSVFNENEFQSILAYKISGSANVFGYLIAFIDKDRQYDYLNRLLWTTKAILEEKIAMHKLIDYHETMHRLSEKLLSSKNLGLYKIEDNLFYLQNEESKKQLESTEDFIPFEDFQKKIDGQMIYIDDLLRKDNFDIKIKRTTGTATYHVNLWQIDMVIYLLFEDITPTLKKDEDLSLLAHIYETYQLNTLHALRKSIEAMQVSSTLMGFWINGEGIFTLTRQERHRLYQEMQNRITESARSHLICLALDEEEGLLLHLATVDKRITQRIFTEINLSMGHLFKTQEYLHADLEIKMGAVVIQKNMSFDDILISLDKTRFEETKDNLVYYDKTIIMKENQFQLLSDQFQTFMNQKRIPLTYSEIGNLLTKKIEGYMVNVDEYVLHGKIDDFSAMIAAKNQTINCFNLVLASVIQALSDLNAATSHTVLMMIPLPAEVLINTNLLEESLKKIRKNKIPLDRFVFRIDRLDIAYQQFEVLTYMKEKGIRLAFETGIFAALELMSIHPSLVDYLLISSDSMNESTKHWFESLSRYMKQKTIIIDNHQQIAFEVLKEAKVYLVSGIFKNALTLDEIKAMI